MRLNPWLLIWWIKISDKIMRDSIPAPSPSSQLRINGILLYRSYLKSENEIDPQGTSHK